MALKYFSKKDAKINWDMVDMVALQMLDDARGLAGIPFIITSNHRTKEQDIALAGFTGAHTDSPCSAFDLIAADGVSRFKIIKALMDVGFNRIGINVKNNHIHVDRSPKLPQNVFWVE